MVPAQGRDVRIAVMAGKYAQEHGAAHVAHGGGVGAGVNPGTILDPQVETPTGLEKLGEEDQLAQGGDGGVRIPFHPDTPATGVEVEMVGERGHRDRFGQHCLTWKVSRDGSDL